MNKGWKGGWRFRSTHVSGNTISIFLRVEVNDFLKYISNITFNAASSESLGIVMF